MKKARILTLVLCIIAMTALLAVSAFAAESTHGGCTVVTDTSGKVTEVRNAVIYALNYGDDGKPVVSSNKLPSITTASTEAASVFAKSDEGKLIDTGLRYDFKDGKFTVKTVGTSTLYNTYGWGNFPVKLMKELWNSDDTFEGGYFTYADVTEVEIPDGVTTIWEWGLRSFNKAVKITIPESLTTIKSSGLANLISCKSMVVRGSKYDFDGIIDMRYFTDFSGWSLCSSSFTNTDLTDIYILLGAKSKTKDGGGFGQYLSTSTGCTVTKKVHICTEAGDQSCYFGTKLSANPANILAFNEIVYEKFPEIKMPNHALTEEGFQVRVSGYNGLRKRFVIDTSVTNDGYTLKEIGFIASPCIDGVNTKPQTIAIATVNDSGEFVKAGAKNYLFTDKDGKLKFGAAIVEYENAENMVTPVYLAGYEVWESETNGEMTLISSDLTDSFEPVSIYEATIGMYREGLIDHEVEQDNVFWSILDECRATVTLTDGLTDESNPSYWYTAYKSTGAVNKVIGTRNNAPIKYAYRLEDEGKNLRDNVGNGDVIISLFEYGEAENGEKLYTAIARPVDKDGNWTTGATLKGDFFEDENWCRANHLSECFIGKKIDKLILDYGITGSSSYAFIGFYENATVQKHYTATPGEYTEMKFSTSLDTIIIPSTYSNLGASGLSKCTKLKTFVRFDKDKAAQGEAYVKEAEGIIDTCSTDNNGKYLTLGSTYVFSSVAAKTILLPPSTTQKVFSRYDTSGVAKSSGFFSSSPSVTRIYCPVSGYGVPAEGTADLRGTGYIMNAEDENTLTSNQTFSGMQLWTWPDYHYSISKVISDDGSICERSYDKDTKVWSSWSFTPPEDVIKLGGILLGNFTVESEGFATEKAELQSWIEVNGLNDPTKTSGKIVLASSEDSSVIGYTETSIKLDGTTITIMVNDYSENSMANAVSSFKKLVNEREEDEIETIDETFSTLDGTVNPLSNTYKKLTEDKKLNIAYLGGSITYGQGAVSLTDTSTLPEQYCWASLTTAWFKQNFPDAEITHNNAGIGDTTSDYGLFRLDRDVFSESIPDLFFIEYTSNDFYGKDNISAATESIIQRVYEKNPNCDIVFVYTTPQTTYTSDCYKADHELAEHYGLMELGTGRLLARKVIAEDLVTAHDGKYGISALSNDKVHPNKAGYALYMELISEYLDYYLVDNAPESPAYKAGKTETLNSASALMLKPAMVDVNKAASIKDCTSGTWTSTTNNTLGRGRKTGESGLTRFETSQNGATITFDFTGTAFGILINKSATFGDYSYSLDGGAYVNVTLGTNSGYNNNKTALVVNGLTDTDHTITIKSIPSAQNGGCDLKILKVLVNGEIDDGWSDIWKP